MFDWLAQRFGTRHARWLIVVWYGALLIALWKCALTSEAVFPYAL